MRCGVTLFTWILLPNRALYRAITMISTSDRNGWTRYTKALGSTPEFVCNNREGLGRSAQTLARTQLRNDYFFQEPATPIIQCAGCGAKCSHPVETETQCHCGAKIVVAKEEIWDYCTRTFLEAPVTAWNALKELAT